MDKHNLLQRSLLLATLATLSFSCTSSPTGPHITGNMQLTADYVTCTEVWLKVAFSGQQTANSGAQFRITRDGDTVLTGTFSGTDTVMIDTAAQPERTYRYKGYRLVNNEVSDTSLPLEITTLDTTSNNFTWQTYTFGGTAGSSMLNDVAIINDSDIWAVGDIAVKDSSVNGYSVYNLVGWNGGDWQLQQIFSYVFCGQSLESVSASWAVLPWSSGNIWIATNSEIVPWNGTLQSEPICTESPTGFDIYRMWGVDPSHVFAVGRAGGLAVYDGYSWRILSSGTNLDIHDVWGVSDSTSRESQVLAVASDQFTDNGVAVLQLSRTQTTMLRTAGLPATSIVGVWSANGREWYVCGDGLYKSMDLNEPWERIMNVPSVYLEAIRGTGPNDIFAVGSGIVLHFNGSRWFNCRNQISAPSLQLYGVAVKGNTIVAVGQTVSGGIGGAGLVLVGKRN
ncbi:MAG: hypothetical protein M1469_08810 [Bacteroidetes bacterium]|nr:hypothetical protein [Bacteroidota bacterium]